MTAADVVEAEILAEVTEPGVYELTEAEYHADPVPGGSLSASGAKLLLPPSCPALYRYRRDHPLIKAEFDFGTAAHKLVLGAGQPICRLSYDDWRTKAAQAARDEARAQGYVPVLEPDWQRVEAMAAAIRAHPVAGQLFDPARGTAEQSLFWQDPDYGIWRRARPDWILNPRSIGGRFVIADYKTTTDASPAAIRKTIANLNYHMQAAWYTDALEQFYDLGPAFLFVFQEKTPPYLITIAELDDDATRAGRARNRDACEIWRDCTQAGVWPGYTDDIELITLPPWAARTEGDLYS
jgi:hypothetical protein